MMPIRAALRALLVAVLAALTVATPAPQAQALVHVYTYDGCHPTASSTYAITERGPPAENVNLNAYDADGLRQFGAVECPEGIGGPTSYDYDDTQWSVRIERGSWTVEWPIGSARAKHAVHARWCVAASIAENSGHRFSRFAVDSSGETTMFMQAGKESLEVTEHAAQRMTQRGISIDAAESALRQKPFQYFHQEFGRRVITIQRGSCSSER